MSQAQEHQVDDDGGPKVGTDELADSTVVRLKRILYRARRAGLVRTLVLVALALVAGFLAGRGTTPDPLAAVRAQLENEVLPLVFDADGIWTSPITGGLAVSEGMVGLQRDGDAAPIVEAESRWLNAYDELLGRIAAIEVAPEGRPVQRQFITGVTLSRDAVVVLSRAARIEDEARRAGLLTEAARLRIRSEQSVQSARAGIDDLGRGTGQVEPLPDLPPFPAPDAPD